MVASYYQALLTDDVWEALCHTVPTNSAELSKKSAARTIEDTFGGACCHFSHYAKANDTIPIRDGSAWALWLRGTAVLFQLSQELANRAMPISFSKVGLIAPGFTSTTLDQDQAGQWADPRTSGIQSCRSAWLIFTRKYKASYCRRPLLCSDRGREYMHDDN
jgi:hypothetical protein